MLDALLLQLKFFYKLNLPSRILWLQSTNTCASSPRGFPSQLIAESCRQSACLLACLRLVCLRIQPRTLPRIRITPGRSRLHCKRRTGSTKAAFSRKHESIPPQPRIVFFIAEKHKFEKLTEHQNLYCLCMVGRPAE